MKKLLYFILTIVAAVLVFSVILFLFVENKGKGALQITASVTANVYLNGKLVGTTPFCKCEQKDLLTEGDYTLKLVAKSGNFDPFEQMITIAPNALTAVDKNFAQRGFGNASVINLSQVQDSKVAQLLVVTFPGKAQVYVDNNSKGESPVWIKDIGVADHNIKISKSGYQDKIVRVRTVSGFKLNAVIYLGLNPVATSGASWGALPSNKTQTVTILNTPTGFLRVRDQASLNSNEIGQVKPGETYNLLDEQNGWYQIEFNNQKGWISGQYAQKNG